MNVGVYVGVSLFTSRIFFLITKPANFPHLHWIAANAVLHSPLQQQHRTTLRIRILRPIIANL